MLGSTPPSAIFLFQCNIAFILHLDERRLIYAGLINDVTNVLHNRALGPVLISVFCTSSSKERTDGPGLAASDNDRFVFQIFTAASTCHSDSNNVLQSFANIGIV